MGPNHILSAGGRRTPRSVRLRGHKGLSFTGAWLVGNQLSGITSQQQLSRIQLQDTFYIYPE
jgi:hypothetical protein